MSVKGDSLTTRHLTLQILCGIFPFFPLPLSPRCSVLVLICFASSQRAAKPRLRVLTEWQTDKAGNYLATRWKSDILPLV